MRVTLFASANRVYKLCQWLGFDSCRPTSIADVKDFGPRFVWNSFGTPHPFPLWATNRWGLQVFALRGPDSLNRTPHLNAIRIGLGSVL